MCTWSKPLSPKLVRDPVAFSFTNEYITKTMKSQWEATYPILPKLIKQDRDRMEQEILERERQYGIDHALRMLERSQTRTAPSKPILQKEKVIREIYVTEEMRKLIDTPLTAADYFAAYAIIHSVRQYAEGPPAWF